MRNPRDGTYEFYAEELCVDVFTWPSPVSGGMVSNFVTDRENYNNFFNRPTKQDKQAGSVKKFNCPYRLGLPACYKALNKSDKVWAIFN